MIIAVTPMVTECIEENGIYITSGIINDRIDDVSYALKENGFEILYINNRKDWACIVCRARGRK